MANILLDGAHWTDSTYGGTPPVYWNGTTYDYIGSTESGQFYYGASMQYAGTVNDGDMVAGSVHSTSADPTEFSVSINGDVVDTVELATGQTYEFSHSLAAGATVIVTLGSGDYLYSQDAVLTPAPNVKQLLRVSPNPNFTNPPVVLVGTSTTPPFILSIPS